MLHLKSNVIVFSIKLPTVIMKKCIFGIKCSAPMIKKFQSPTGNTIHYNSCSRDIKVKLKYYNIAMFFQG